MPSAIPTIAEPQYPTTLSPSSSISSDASSTHHDYDVDESPTTATFASDDRLSRPKVVTRKSSGTMIISRDAPTTIVEPELDEHDMRSMSPRRNPAEVDALGEVARRDMYEQARQLQKSLEAIVDRLEVVKTEHAKLEGGNKFLQSYIGELMQTSRITASQPSKGKTKGRLGK